MHIGSLENFFVQVLLWYAPVLIGLIFWPLLRRRRAYVVVAAVLCLTPVLVDFGFLEEFPARRGFPDWYGPIAPLLVALPEKVLQWPDSFPVILYMVLPAGAFVAVIAWFLARRFVPAASSDESVWVALGVWIGRIAGAPRLRGGPPSDWQDERWVWTALMLLWTVIHRLWNLLLLLCLIVAYVLLLYVPLRYIARL